MAIEVHLPVVEIEWGDAVSTNGWHRQDDCAKTPTSCISMGYLIKKDKVSYTLIQSLDVDCKLQSAALTIPTKMVRKVRTLRKG